LRHTLEQEETVTPRAQLATPQVPEWVAAEMPPGYQTRLVEIERLVGELREMDAIGRVLYETGEPLREGVRAVFAALKCEGGPMPDAPWCLAAKLDGPRRLLVYVPDTDAPLQKASEALTHAFQLVQLAGDHDRVVLVANNDAATPPAQRPDPVRPDALQVLQRMGVNVATTGTLIGLWRQSFTDPQRVRTLLDRLHAQDGGAFVVSAKG
jgi:hypothetical protein